MTRAVGYVAPSFGAASYNCPHCGSFAQQIWGRLVHALVNSNSPQEIISGRVRDLLSLNDYRKKRMQNILPSINDGRPRLLSLDSIYNVNHEVFGAFISECQACEEVAFWCSGSLLWPASVPEYRPNDDLPDDIKGIFIEARNIVQASPRVRTGIEH